jgi:hypothetical protein
LSPISCKHGLNLSSTLPVVLDLKQSQNCREASAIESSDFCPHAASASISKMQVLFFILF